MRTLRLAARGHVNQAGGGSYVYSARYASRQGPLPRCPGCSVGRERIERAVGEYVQTLLADPALLRAQYAAGQASPAVDGQAAAEQARLERQLSSLDYQGQRLLDAYQAGTISAPVSAKRCRTRRLPSSRKCSNWSWIALSSRTTRSSFIILC